jgi:type IV pilus assembly protein PilB
MSAVTQGPAAAASALTGLARALVQQGKLRPDRAETLARKAVQSSTQFIDELIGIAESTGLTSSVIARFAADTFGHPLFDLTTFDTDQLPSDIIDRKLVGSLRVIALRKRGNRLAVAVSDPTNFQALDQVKFQTQLALDVVVVEHDKLLKLIESAGRSVSESLERLVDDDVNFEDLLGTMRSRKKRPRRSRSMTHRLSGSFRSFSWMRSAKGRRTSTSSPTRSSTACASASTACCVKWRSRLWRSASDW